jgi:hypothetical protein
VSPDAGAAGLVISPGFRIQLHPGLRSQTLMLPPPYEGGGPGRGCIFDKIAIVPIHPTPDPSPS